MESQITYHASAGAEMHGLPPGSQWDVISRSFGRVQSREYVKRISEEEVEHRVAYEVSVSKVDLLEDE